MSLYTPQSIPGCWDNLRMAVIRQAIIDARSRNIPQSENALRFLGGKIKNNVFAPASDMAEAIAAMTEEDKAQLRNCETNREALAIFYGLRLRHFALPEQALHEPETKAGARNKKWAKKNAEERTAYIKANGILAYAKAYGILPQTAHNWAVRHGLADYAKGSKAQKRADILKNIEGRRIQEVAAEIESSVPNAYAFCTRNGFCVRGGVVCRLTAEDVAGRRKRAELPAAEPRKPGKPRLAAEDEDERIAYARFHGIAKFAEKYNYTLRSARNWCWKRGIHDKGSYLPKADVEKVMADAEGMDLEEIRVRLKTGRANAYRYARLFGFRVRKGKIVK